MINEPLIWIFVKDIGYRRIINHRVKAVKQIIKVQTAKIVPVPVDKKQVIARIAHWLYISAVQLAAALIQRRYPDGGMFWRICQRDNIVVF